MSSIILSWHTQLRSNSTFLSSPLSLSTKMKIKSLKRKIIHRKGSKIALNMKISNRRRKYSRKARMKIKAKKINYSRDCSCMNRQRLNNKS